MSTKTQHQLTRQSTKELAELASLEESYQVWVDAQDSTSGDAEHAAAGELIDALLSYARITITTTQVEVCDECDETATCFWPTLRPPVQMCDGCHHNARRSGWIPGT